MKRMRWVAAILALWTISAAPAAAQEAELPPEWSGPGRFCGFGPIIDVTADERIQSLSAGIHGGTFEWRGRFGEMRVYGTGWAAKPKGRALPRRTSKGHIRFAERREEGRYTVALWNGAHGAAYFSSPRPLTRAQLSAIDRVDLFNEGEEPEGCNRRTISIIDWGDEE